MFQYKRNSLTLCSELFFFLVADAFSEVEQRGKYLRESDRKDNEQEVPEEKPEDSEKFVEE